MRHGLVLLFCLTALFFTGCSAGEDFGPSGTMKGRIVVPAEWEFPGGDSCAGTKIKFICDETGYGAIGTADENGDFVMEYKRQKKIPVGSYNVSIEGPDNRTPERESGVQRCTAWRNSRVSGDAGKNQFWYSR